MATTYEPIEINWRGEKLTALITSAFGLAPWFDGNDIYQVAKLKGWTPRVTSIAETVSGYQASYMDSRNIPVMGSRMAPTVACHFLWRLDSTMTKEESDSMGQALEAACERNRKSWQLENSRSAGNFPMNP